MNADKKRIQQLPDSLMLLLNLMSPLIHLLWYCAMIQFILFFFLFIWTIRWWAIQFGFDRKPFNCFFFRWSLDCLLWGAACHVLKMFVDIFLVKITFCPGIAQIGLSFTVLFLLFAASVKKYSEHLEGSLLVFMGFMSPDSLMEGTQTYLSF